MMASCAPSAAKALATARPMPRPAPVTTIFFPANLDMGRGWGGFVFFEMLNLWFLEEFLEVGDVLWGVCGGEGDAEAGSASRNGGETNGGDEVALVEELL